MQLISLQATDKILNLVVECKRYHVAVAWAGPNLIVDAMLKHHQKMGKMVIGTHMYQTDPFVLERFSNHAGARCVPPNGKLFHPKIYLFELHDRFAAVIGSHNLTNGAFGERNIEASILIEGEDSDVFDQIEEFISYHHRDAQLISKNFLFSYKIQHAQKAAKLRDLETFNDFKMPGLVDDGSIYTRSWADFVDGVSGDKNHSLEGRLAVLGRAATLFLESPSFRVMPEPQRKAIAGTFGQREHQLEGLDWGFFGRMGGHGDFAGLVKRTPALLSSALDQIPDSGMVTKEQYLSFINLYNRAFEHCAHKGKVPGASRLLTLKRPDFFASVNEMNKRGICRAFGNAYSSLSVSNYWERIVLPMHASAWWSHERPRHGLEARIWDNRAALIDSIFYQPTII